MIARVALALGLLALSAARAEVPGPGAMLPSFTLEDQHGKPAEVGPDVRVLLVSHDMDAGGLVKEALATTPQSALDEAGVVYVADISGMPRLVSRLFALPRMRDRPYRVLVDADGARTRDLPRAKGRVTAIRLERLRILAIDQLDSADAVRRTVLRPQPQAP